MNPSIKFLCILMLLFFGGHQTHAQSKVSFTIKNAGTTVEGYFVEFETDVVVDSKNLKASRFDGKVKISSIQTGIAMRDRHLLKKEYFNAEKFPEMNFKTREMKLMSDGSFRAVGDITIKGTTRALEFKIVTETSGTKSVYRAQAKLNRRDFEVGGWSLTMSDEVVLNIIIEKNP